MTGSRITLRGATKSFAGPRGPIRAVRGIDVEIDRGETVALLGPNGAGKSTTIDMLLGLLAPDAGSVSVFGRSPSQAVAAGAVGAMLQQGELIRELSVRELLSMTAALYPAPLAVEELLALTGLADVAEQRTQKLSGGQTQRVRLALALAPDPELLVLDEPTVAMDVEGRHAFWRSMRELAARGRTLLFATHYLEEADAYADRVVLMAHGEVVADAAPGQIRATVAARTIRATLPDVELSELQSLPGVSGAERRGAAVVLACADSDAAVRALLAAFPEVRDIEITSAGLEEAFLAERAAGWTRQLRITPLSPRAYFRAKVLTAYALALASMAVLYVAGATLGVSMSAARWLEMSGLILVGLVPFAALGVAMGHVLTPDSIGPAIGGSVSLLALLGGTWFPLGHSGALYEIARFLPSYWLVQAGRVALGASAWSARGWLVIAVWTALLSVLALRLYWRDTGRV